MKAQWLSSRNTSAKKSLENRRSKVPQKTTLRVYSRGRYKREQITNKLVIDAYGIVHTAVMILSHDARADTAITACDIHIAAHGAGRKNKTPTCLGCLVL